MSKSINFPSTTKSGDRRRKTFVPLSDLLQRKHDDRVSEYLEKMKGLTFDEIINPVMLKKITSGEETA